MKDSRFILIFIDGLGLGAKGSNNPLTLARMPTLHKLIDGVLDDSVNKYGPDIICKGIDATLGVPGIPQSATGQTALFTGVNAAKYLGYHLPAFPDETLVGVIQQHSVLKQIAGRGLKGCFANAYRPDYFENTDSYSVTTHCVLAADLPFLFVNDLLAHKAVYWDITNSHLHHQYDQSIPIISPHDAGKNLTAIASHHQLTIFECFESDLIGHRKDMEHAILFLEKLDVFLSGVLENLADDTTVILSSDHGNIEALDHGAHTLNPVPLLVIGDQSAAFSQVKSIVDVVPIILSVLPRAELQRSGM